MKRISMTLIALIFFGLYSCEDLEQVCGIDNPDLGLAEDGVSLLGIVVNTYDRVDEALRNPDIQNNGQATLDNANVTWNGSLLTIDFGNGISGADGKVRKGIIKAEVTGNYFQTGSKTEITFENFSVEDNSVKGTMAVNNDTQANPLFSISTVGLSFSDKVGLTTQMYFEWQNGFATQNDLADDVFTLAGNGDLDQLNSNQELGLDIVHPIRIERACQWGVVEGEVHCNWTGDDVPFSELDLDFIVSDGCNNLYQIGVDCGETSGTITKSFSGF